MKPQVEIYDTTLRDGSQGEGINFSVADKLRIAEKLDAFGVHYIEGGWPGSNPKDMEFFAQASRRKWKNAKIAAFSMTRRKGVAVEKRRVDAADSRSENAGRHHRRQDVAAACHRGVARQAGRKPGDDRRHHPLSEGPRQNGHLRRRTQLRRFQGRAGIRAGHVAGRGEGGRGMHRVVRHERRLSAGGNRARSPRWRRANSRRASASTRTTIAAWAWPMPWPASKPAPPRCRAPSTVTANARAIAI